MLYENRSVKLVKVNWYGLELLVGNHTLASLSWRPFSIKSEATQSNCLSILYPKID